jgi:hypothetical protein
MEEQIEAGWAKAEEFSNVGRIGSHESICFLVVRIAIYCIACLFSSVNCNSKVLEKPITSMYEPN